MKLISFYHAARLGFGVILDSGDVFDLDRALAELRGRDCAGDLRLLLAGGQSALAEAMDLLAGQGRASAFLKRSASLRVLAPIPRPGKILAVGLNYRDHCEEQGKTPPERPMFFAKVASSVIAHGEVIRIDEKVTRQVDHEVELGVVIGRGGRSIPAEWALEHVAGYTIVNDVSARDLQKADRQWTRAKGLDTFCPMGPWLVTSDEIDDPHRLAVRCLVNGEERQRSNTRHLVHGIPQLIAAASAAMTLEPGDVISTGTPGGVGVYRQPPVFLKPGDIVTCEIEGIGELTNPVGAWSDAEERQ
ncbi:MAG: fumarylacetoacetate hydrolase family protein [Planctomycetota bacterium]